MDDRLTALLNDISRAADLAGAALARAQRRTLWLAESSAEQIAEFLQAVGQLPLPLHAAADQLLAAALAAVVRRAHEPAATKLAAGQVSQLQSLYSRLGKASHARAQLLVLLATNGTAEALHAFVELLVADPPGDDADVVQTLAPLFRGAAAGTLPIAAIFPRLLGALAHPQLAAGVLDLANFLMRQRRVSAHPAASRAPELIGLLGELVQSLFKLEESPPGDEVSPVELSQRVAAQVALAVSLCDALALIGEADAIGKLHQALALRHRRLRTEAAAALARLGDEDGARVLVKLAEEPVARLRVLAYAEELGLAERIDQEWQTPQARAEAQLALHLAEPTQFGVPPARLELFDQRRQFWPGSSEPVDCFLFRYTYAVTIAEEGERSLSNIGMAGPVAHAFLADLADLAPDDIYAAYAGWHAQHEEIRQFDVARLSKSERLEALRLVRRMHDAGYAQIEPQLMGYFLGDKALVTTVVHEGVAGVAIADFKEIAFFPRRHSRRPLGAQEAYCIYKGRKLLKSFNRV